MDWLVLKLQVGKLKFLAGCVYFSILAVVILAPIRQVQAYSPGRDEGAFLYGAQQLLLGKVPYRDFWDHKGPLIYLLNAVGLLISRGMTEGVWVVELVSLCVAAIFGIWLACEIFGKTIGWTINTLWLLGFLMLIKPGNWVEEYAIPLQILTLCLAWRWLAEKNRRSYLWLMGATFALLLFLRPNLIAIHIAFYCLLFLDMAFSHRWKWGISNFGILFSGAFITGLPIVIWLVSSGAWPDFIDQYVVYNRIYLTLPIGNRLATGLMGLISLPFGLTILGMAGWFLGWFTTWSRHLDSRLGEFLKILTAGWLFELVMASLSGRAYPHYFLSWLPCLFLLAGFTLLRLSDKDQWPCRTGKLAGVICMAGVIALFLVISYGLISRIIILSKVNSNDPAKLASASVQEYILANTGPHDSVLLWGAECWVNFLTHRAAPGRFCYQYPLFTSGYSSPVFAQELLEDIRLEKPLIIDTSSTNEWVPPIDAARRRAWEQMRPLTRSGLWGGGKNLVEVYGYLDAHYTQVGIFESNGWIIYRFTWEEEISKRGISLASLSPRNPPAMR